MHTMLTRRSDGFDAAFPCATGAACIKPPSKLNKLPRASAAAGPSVAAGCTDGCRNEVTSCNWAAEDEAAGSRDDNADDDAAEGMTGVS